MKAGDLVRPLMSCAGEPGTSQCETALVSLVYEIGKEPYNQSFNQPQCRVVCKCGSSVQFEKHLKVISSAK